MSSTASNPIDRLAAIASVSSSRRSPPNPFYPKRGFFEATLRSDFFPLTQKRNGGRFRR
jgi:hypothetical protein